jgi:hypothetical protein
MGELGRLPGARIRRNRRAGAYPANCLLIPPAAARARPGALATPDSRRTDIQRSSSATETPRTVYAPACPWEQREERSFSRGRPRIAPITARLCALLMASLCSARYVPNRRSGSLLGTAKQHEAEHRTGRSARAGSRSSACAVRDHRLLIDGGWGLKGSCAGGGAVGRPVSVLLWPVVETGSRPVLRATAGHVGAWGGPAWAARWLIVAKAARTAGEVFSTTNSWSSSSRFIARL